MPSSKERDPATHDVEQVGQMLAQRGDLLQGEFQPVGQERQERSRGAFGAEGGFWPQPSQPMPWRKPPSAAAVAKP